MKTIGICTELIVRAVISIALILCTFGIAFAFFDFEEFMEVRR